MGGTPMPRVAAFTLIELLLVLVILGVLAALVVPKFTGTSKRAKEQAANTQINSNFKTALSAFEIDCGRFPTTDEGLNALIVQPSNAKGWTHAYLDALTVPNDPWGNPYVYRCPGTHRTDSYDLYSTGADGADGTDSAGDNINNWTQK
jgi:general secretion pathway protein G